MISYHRNLMNEEKAYQSKATICVDYDNRILFWSPRIYVVSKCLIVWHNQSVFQSTIFLLSSVFVAQFRTITKMLHRIWKHLTFVHAFLKQIPSNWKKFFIFLRCSFKLLFSQFRKNLLQALIWKQKKQWFYNRS